MLITEVWFAKPNQVPGEIFRFLHTLSLFRLHLEGGTGVDWNLVSGPGKGHNGEAEWSFPALWAFYPICAVRSDRSEIAQAVFVCAVDQGRNRPCAQRR